MPRIEQGDRLPVHIRGFQRVHAFPVTALTRAASTALNPADFALEQHVLVAAGERLLDQRDIRRIAPEPAFAAKCRRSRAEERQRRRVDQTSEMGYACIRTYEQPRARYQVPQLRQIKLACVTGVSSLRIDALHNVPFAGSTA